MELVNNRKGWKIFIGVTSVIAGLHFLFYPDDVELYIIRLIGLMWLIEGIFKLILLKSNENTK